MSNSRLRHGLGRRHSAPAKAAAFVALYALYELLRGLTASGAATAIRHGREVASVERTLRVFVEPSVAHAASTIPGLLGALALCYLTFHLGATAVAFTWLYRRRPELYARVRTTLLLTTGFSLIGYLTFPTAPPRLAVRGA